MFKKQKRAIVWTAYSRLQKRVIAYHIGEGKSAAKEIYRKVKKLRPIISHIYSDANSCYDIRLLSKLKHKIKITNGRDKVKSKRKTFSTTSIFLGNNFKSFNKAYDIFDFNSLTGNTTVFEFIRRS